MGAMVYLIEDDEGSRHSMECLFAAHGIATKSFESAERFLDVHSSDTIAPVGCIVSDLVLPGISGQELLQQTRLRGWSIPTIIVTAFGEVSSVVLAFRSGVHDFLEKPVPAEILIGAVTKCLAWSMNTHEFESNKSRAVQQLAKLTKRERTVLSRLVEGHAMKEIAKEFGTSFQSVSAHRKRIFAKLNVEGDVKLAEWIRRHQLELDLKRGDDEVGVGQ